MRVLLDECVPHDLRPLIAGHEAYTVAHLGWNGVKNGELLRRAAASGFEAMISTDQGLAAQHDPAKLQIAVIVLCAKTSRMADLAPLVPAVLKLLEKLPQPGFYTIQ